MTAPVQLPSDGDQSGRELKVKALERFPWILKTGTPSTEPVEPKPTEEPQSGMYPLFRPSDRKP